MATYYVGDIFSTNIILNQPTQIAFNWKSILKLHYLLFVQHRKYYCDHAYKSYLQITAKKSIE